MKYNFYRFTILLAHNNCFRWPNGQIPYVLSSRYGDYSKKMFAKVFQEYAKKSCIRFIPKTSEHKDFIYIFPEDGCYSLVGRIGGRQPVSLDEGTVDILQAAVIVFI